MACAVSVREASGIVKHAKVIDRQEHWGAKRRRRWVARLSAALVAIALVVLAQMFSGVPSHIAMTSLGAALARISNCGIGSADRRRPGWRPLCESTAVARL